MLTWNHDKPKEPGWYRYRRPDGTIQLLHLKLVDDEAFFEGQTETAWPWEYYPGEWRGPIDPPGSQRKEG